jgi:DinB superfamily
VLPKGSSHRPGGESVSQLSRIEADSQSIESGSRRDQAHGPHGEVILKNANRAKLKAVSGKSAKATTRRRAKHAAQPDSRNGAATKPMTQEHDAALREQLVYLLKGGGAHVHFMDAVEKFPAGKRGTYAQGLAHTAWQLLDHARIAQRDILEFSRNHEHVSPEFPEGYWPKTPAPQSEDEWNDCVSAFKRDLRDMIRLIENPKTDLYAPIPHGQGQTILREALVLADHNSYHLGQLVDLRRALGSWPEA